MAQSYAEAIERLPAHERGHVRELAEDVLFMRGKLEETRHGLERQQVVIPYDNGGGQAGIRENPAFTGYHKLLKSYMAALGELRGILDGAGASKAEPRVVSMVGNSKLRQKMAANG